MSLSKYLFVTTSKILGYKTIFVKIRAVHLGHTLIETAYARFFKPMGLYFQRPLANKWLCQKLSEAYKFSSENKKILTISSEELLELGYKDFNSLYFLLNLGFNVFPKRLPQIKFTKKELDDCERFLKKYKIRENNYVLFCLRDETYYSTFKKDLAPGYKFGFRNSNVKNYEGAAEECLKNGIMPIRFGFSERRVQRSKFFDINSCPDYRPWIEAYLAKNPLFAVGNFTGSTLYCKMFGVPVLWIDVFWRGSVVGNPGDFLAPKHLCLNGERLSLEDQKKLGPPKDNLFENYKLKGLRVENLSKEMITNCVKEMLRRTKKEIGFNECDPLNLEFKKMHFKRMIDTGLEYTPLLNYWIQNNRRLIVTRRSKLKNSLYEDFWLGKEQSCDPDADHSKKLDRFYSYLLSE